MSDCAAVHHEFGWRCLRCGTYGDNDEPVECLTPDEIAENALAAMRRITQGEDCGRDS